VEWLVIHLVIQHVSQGSKNPGFLKKPNPVGFIGFWGFIIGVFLDKQEKIGKIIQKTQ